MFTVVSVIITSGQKINRPKRHYARYVKIGMSL
jgi:hypothetical protein